MKKIFKIKNKEKELSLYFKAPTHEEVMIIDMEYRKIYSIAVRNDVITKAEAIKQYKKSGAWTKEDDTEVGDLMLKLSLLETVIKDKNKDKTERREAALKAANIRSDLLQKMDIRTSLFEHTAEYMAEQQKLHKFIILCTCKEEDDERLFDTKEEYQDFLNEYPVLGSSLYKEAYFYDYELPEDISESWAEVQFLREDIEEEKANKENKPKKKTRKKKVESK